jgi:NAD(P)-dependent dehydrogenase (short-subunit alcohol dehydrogenase family)
MDAECWGGSQVARTAQGASAGALPLIASVWRQRPDPQAVLEDASNAAVAALVRGVALACAPMRVHALAPGLIDTPLSAGMDAEQRHAMLPSAARALPL